MQLSPRPTSTGRRRIRLGEDLQESATVNLSVAPPAPVNITLTSADPRSRSVSTSATVLGGTTLTFNNVGAVTANNYFVQATGTAGQSTNITVTAAGYNTLTVP